MTVYSGVCHVCRIRLLFFGSPDKCTERLTWHSPGMLVVVSVGPPVDNMSLCFDNRAEVLSPLTGYTFKADRRDR